MDASGPGQASHQAIDLAAGLDRVMGDHAMHLRVLGRFRADYRDTVARLCAVARALVFPVHGDRACRDERGGLRARKLAPRGYQQIEANIAVRLDGEFMVRAAAAGRPAAGTAAQRARAAIGHGRLRSILRARRRSGCGLGRNRRSLTRRP